jgi:5-methylcytosine-specific restriction endonuclease McrA
MLFHEIRRAFTIFSMVEAVKKCDDPMFFIRLLNRPNHLKPKPGKKSRSDVGQSFPSDIKQRAKKETNNRCVFCAVKTNTSSPLILSKQSSIDHAIPKSRGGANTLQNAQHTCYPCNAEKGALTTKEYLVEKFGPKGLQLIRRG